MDIDKKIGFTREEMKKEPLPGKSNPPMVRHAFVVCSQPPTEWGKEVATPLIQALQSEIDKTTNKSSIRITACTMIPGEDSEGDVLVFPDFVRIKGVLKSSEDVADFADRLKSDVPFAVSEDSSLLTESQVMVCAHAKRDERCGYCGPILASKFEEVQKKLGKENICKVRKCSHIGGHIYAGNIIVFRPPKLAPNKDDNSGGDWFGYVTPDDVPKFISMCELDSSTYPPHEVHHLWRGRFGVKEEEHVELCGKVAAACSGCTASVGDMEDGVEGRPSPTVKAAKKSKKDKSPSIKPSIAAATPPPLVNLIARVVFILGPPGTGKGTQCENLVRDYDLIHLSAGDLLREERLNPASQDGQLIENYIKEGKIVPVAITVRLLWNAMSKHMSTSGRTNFLIDGFPRNQDNLDGWNAQLGPDKVRVVGCIFLDCDEAIVEARLLERGKTSGRVDDNLASIRKRFSTYVNETMPIVKLFEQRKMSWKIDSSQPKDAVYADVRKVIDEFVLPKKRYVVFVLGGPGAGKGTQCANLVRDYDCTHLSAGDLLRAERANPNSQDGKLIESYIVEGKIVPVKITVNLLVKAMKKSGSRNFLIDGFPRNLDNVQGWNEVVGEDSNDVKVAGVLFFDLPEEVMEKRLLQRAIDDGANARSDDNIATIRKRFHTFRDETMPIINLYQKKNMVWSLKADQPVDVVYKQVQKTVTDVFLPALNLPQVVVQKKPTTIAEAIKAVPTIDQVVHNKDAMKLVAVLATATAFAVIAAFVVRGRKE